MLRLYRKTINCRWHANCKNFPEKKHEKYTKPRPIVLYTASQKHNHSNQEDKKQHANKQDKRCWDDPQFHFNFFRTSVFETAGCLGTAALCLSYHLKRINNIFEHEKANSSCLFSNIVHALPRRSSEIEKPASAIPNSVVLRETVHNLENDEVLIDGDILESIETFSKQYTAALENSIGISSINKSHKKAFRSFQNAARLGSSVGLYNLGLCYQLGKGTRVNLNMAAFCYKKAAMKGHGLACFNLATFFYKGIGGLPVDFKIAKELLAEAAEKGVPEAQMYFGISFLEEKKWPDAVKIFSTLVDKNLPDAQYYLGLCYENGLSVERNEKIAFELFKKSAGQGNERALEKLQNIKIKKSGVHHSLIKSPVVKHIEQSNNLHTSSSVPELSAYAKESKMNTLKFPLLAYLDLFLIVKNDNFNLKDKCFVNEKKLVKDYSNTFMPFKNIDLVVMQVKN